MCAESCERPRVVVSCVVYYEQDTRFQALMPDPLHWLGVTKIHRFISMSDMKYEAITSSVSTSECSSLALGSRCY